jgi:hypothetical protein
MGATNLTRKKTRTRHAGKGFCWVSVWVGSKIPLGNPCNSLALDVDQSDSEAQEHIELLDGLSAMDKMVSLI